MATLTNADFRFIQQYVMSQPALRAEFKAWSLPRPALQAGLQAIEDYVVGSFSARPAGTSRAAIEAAVGATTVARAQAIFSAWAAWKAHSLTGG